jgi:predicted enzyme related to lactoylglutathione lyase
VDLRLEVVPIPVSAVDAAKAFYTDQVGFKLDHDARPNEHMRVSQLHQAVAFYRAALASLSKAPK